MTLGIVSYSLSVRQRPILNPETVTQEYEEAVQTLERERREGDEALKKVCVTVQGQDLLVCFTVCLEVGFCSGARDTHRHRVRVMLH